MFFSLAWGLKIKLTTCKLEKSKRDGYKNFGLFLYLRNTYIESLMISKNDYFAYSKQIPLQGASHK